MYECIDILTEFGTGGVMFLGYSVKNKREKTNNNIIIII